MVNTMAAYLLSAGIGMSFGISTGKDALILTPLKELLPLAERDEADPARRPVRRARRNLRAGGHRGCRGSRAGQAAAGVCGRARSPSSATCTLGHAGAVVEGGAARPRPRSRPFDEYFGVPAFQPEKRYRKQRRSCCRTSPAASASRRCTTCPRRPAALDRRRWAGRSDFAGAPPAGAESLVRRAGRAGAQPAARSWCLHAGQIIPSRTPRSSSMQQQASAGTADPPADAPRLARLRPTTASRRGLYGYSRAGADEGRLVRRRADPVLDRRAAPATRFETSAGGDVPDRLADQRPGHDLGPGGQAVRLGGQPAAHGHDRHPGHASASCTAATAATR